MYSLTCIQPGGGDDHADQRKALRTQSICSRSMVYAINMHLYRPIFFLWGGGGGKELMMIMEGEH